MAKTFHHCIQRILDCIADAMSALSQESTPLRKMWAIGKPEVVPTGPTVHRKRHIVDSAMSSQLAVAVTSVGLIRPTVHPHPQHRCQLFTS